MKELAPEEQATLDLQTLGVREKPIVFPEIHGGSREEWQISTAEGFFAPGLPTLCLGEPLAR